MMDVHVGDRFSAKAGLRFRYGKEYRSALSEVDLREAYIRYQAGPFSFSTGKIFSLWGKGSVFNPVDVVTPQDPTVRSPEEDDRNLGYWGMQAGLNMGKHLSLQALWKPLFRQSVLLLDPIPLPGYVFFIEPDFPGMSIREGSYGFSLEFHSGPADFSLYWFEGYHSWPGIRFAGLSADSMTMEPVALDLQEKAFRIRMAGLDLAIPAGSWILRGEGAWRHPVMSHSKGEYIPFPEWSYVAEAEWTRGGVTLTGGYHGKTILDYTDPPSEPGLSVPLVPQAEMNPEGPAETSFSLEDLVLERIGAFNRLYNYQLEKQYHSLYLAARALFLYDQLEFSIPLIHHLVTREWIVQPEISYRPADGLEIAAGYAGMFGPAGSLYDMVGPTLNAVFLAMTITF